MNFTLDQDAPLSGLACPQCGYALHGLRGPVVTCPECGMPCDLAKIIEQRRIDRFRNPEYRALAAPAFTLAGGLLASTLLGLLFDSFTNHRLFLVAGTFIVLLAWVLRLAVAVLGTVDKEGLRLIALLHVVFLGFLGLVVGGVGALLVMLIRLAEGIERQNLAQITSAVLWSAVAAVTAMVSVPLLRRLDRSIGRRCIRRYLLRDHVAY